MNANNQTGFDYIYSENAQGRFGISEMVFRKIWESIVTQEIPPGEKVTEEFLSKTFDVSRTPLREAIQRLVEIGMIVKQNNRALVVSELNRKNLKDLASVHEHIEGLIAFEVWEKYQTGDISIDALKEWNERMVKFSKMGDIPMILECDLAFHQEMRALSNNRVAKLALEKILLGLEPYRRLAVMETKNNKDYITDHSDFLAALEEPDGERAEQQMREYIRKNHAHYASVLSE